MPRLTKRGKPCFRSWCDLPEELLGDIIQRLDAIGDRLSFRAVCSQWRRAHSQPPPPMPWLVSAGYCVGMHDAAVHRIALPEDDAGAAAAACRGSFDNWLAMVPMSQPPPYQPFLLNPFTMARIQLPVWPGPETISKIVLSSAPDDETSCCCTVAAIAACEFTQNLQRASIAVCRLLPTGQQQQQQQSWWHIVKAFYLHDIAFFEGKLHAVDGSGEQMYAFEDQELEKMRRWPLFHRVPVSPLSPHNKYYLVACHGRLLLVCRSFGINRVPGTAYHHTVGFKVSAVSPSSYGGGNNNPPPQVPVRTFDGHALFVGNACCRAFAIADGESSSKIKENQICYADDEMSNDTSLPVIPDGASGVEEMLKKCHRRRPPLLGSTLQSYDVRTDCFRRYQRGRRPAGAWQCTMVQRLLHRRAMPPPPTTEWGASLLLWEVMKSLGANETPHYCKRFSNPADTTTHVVIDLSVPVYGQNWSFTQSGRSVHEAKQEAAYQAVRFLRSRYHTILDDSPWSSIPHYHRHVDEEDYDEDDEIKALLEGQM